MCAIAKLSKTLAGAFPYRGPKLTLPAAVLVVLLAPFPGHADEPGPDPLDPSNYVRLTWNGRDLVKPPDGKVYEVIGSTGEVKISVDGRRMKELWDFDTRGSLSLRGWVVPAEGDRRNIEIDGYSMVGETLTVFDLDLSAAFEIVSQLLQGDRLANRLLNAERKARLTGLEAKSATLAERLAIEGRIFTETERALRAVYTEALRFTLDGRHIRDAGGLIAAVEAERSAAISPAAAAKAAELDIFFRDLEVQKVALEAWLGSVLSDANRPYLPILAQIARRNEHVVLAIAEEVQKLLQRIEEGGLDEKARSAAMRRLVELAKIVRDIETSVVLHYMEASDKDRIRIQETPQFMSHAPFGHSLRSIKLPDEIIKSCRKTRIVVRQETSGGDGTFGFTSASLSPRQLSLTTLGGSTFYTFPNLEEGIYDIAQSSAAPAFELKDAFCSNGDASSVIDLKMGETVTCTFRSEKESEKKKADSESPSQVTALAAEERLKALEDLLKALVGAKPYEKLSGEVKKKFEDQISESLKSFESIREQKKQVDEAIASTKQELRIQTKAVEDCMPTVKVQAETIEVALMIDVIHSLIDRIDPVFLSLDKLDLSPGDQLAIDVSLKPRRSADTPPPLQMTSTFLVVPWGWRAPAPRVRDVLTFVQPDKGGNFSPSPAVSALWNFYGKSPNKKHWLRTLAPGVGIEAAFLDFDGDDGTIEVGLGVSLSLFDDLIHVTYGENLQQETGDSRKYWGIGVSLTQVVDKFKKKNEE